MYYVRITVKGMCYSNIYFLSHYCTCHYCFSGFGCAEAFCCDERLSAEVPFRCGASVVDYKFIIIITRGAFY